MTNPKPGMHVQHTVGLYFTGIVYRVDKRAGMVFVMVTPDNKDMWDQPRPIDVQEHFEEIA